MMNRDKIAHRMTNLWLAAGDAGLDAEFIQDAIQMTVIAALDAQLERYGDYTDTKVIEETLMRKVNELLLVEIAKIKGT